MPKLITNEISVRECFVPRPGYCYVDIDIEGLELVTLAQVEIWVLGSRRKADFLNAGGDAHCLTGATIHGEGISYEDFLLKAKGDRARGIKVDKGAKEIRQLAKIPNFGKPGGMANATLVSFARTSSGIKLGATPDNPNPSKEVSEAKAEEIGVAWEEANPDDVAYLDWVRTLRGSDKLYRFQLPNAPGALRHYIRSKCTYCAAANTGFQWLGAEVAGNIDWALCRATMVGNGALRKCRVVQMVYDSWLLECPLGLQTDAARELEYLVKTEGGKAVPDVQIRAEAAAMNCWSKAAERIEKDGELLIWTPEQKGN